MGVRPGGDAPAARAAQHRNRPDPEPTAVFDTYWRFAAERQAVLRRRLDGAPAPWTDDPVLRAHRFTNPYRFTDRVSQYLIAEVQNGAGRSQSPRELFFRTALFKLFNRIDTWRAVEAAAGPVAWEGGDLGRIAAALDGRRARGAPLYSAAYVVPPPGLGHGSKHRDHLALLAVLMEARLPERLAQAPSLADAYAMLRAQRSLGPFLAFQLAVDLNYSALMGHDEASFVVAGPGARDGLAKCFSHTGGRSPEALIAWVAERQDAAFAARGLAFARPFGRPLQPVDCQNLFCEISKYARAAHPGVPGSAGRTRIKQRFRGAAGPLAPLVAPPRWGLGPHAWGDAPLPAA